MGDGCKGLLFVSALRFVLKPFVRRVVWFHFASKRKQQQKKNAHVAAADACPAAAAAAVAAAVVAATAAAAAPTNRPACSFFTCSSSRFCFLDLKKTEAELVAALAALDEAVRAKVGQLVRPDELDPFEVRALGKFDVADALDILER